MAKTTTSGQKKATARAAPKKPSADKATSGSAASGKAKTAAKATSTKKTASNQTVMAKKAVAAKKAPAKAPTKKAASNQMPAFDQKFLDRQTELLLVEREKYFQSSVNLASEAQQILETREQGDVQFDEESAQGNSWAIEREQDLILSAGARATVEKIDAALARIKDGTYGICQKTGKPIPKARLQAIPWATERVEQRSTGLLLR